MARAGLGAALGVAFESGSGIEAAVERLGELRGLGTKVGQMAGLVEANLSLASSASRSPAPRSVRSTTPPSKTGAA
jgi:hypothetical protein